MLTKDYYKVENLLILFEQCVLAHNTLSNGDPFLKNPLLDILDTHLKEEFPAHDKILSHPEFNGTYGGNKRQDIPCYCYSKMTEQSYGNLFKILNSGIMSDELVGIDVKHSIDETLRVYAEAFGPGTDILQLLLDLSLLKAWTIFPDSSELKKTSEESMLITSLMPIVVSCKNTRCNKFIFTPEKRKNKEYCSGKCRHSFNNFKKRN